MIWMELRLFAKAGSLFSNMYSGLLYYITKSEIAGPYSKHKMTGGGGPSEWRMLTPPGLGPSVKAYFLVHVRSLHLSTIPFVLVSNFPFVLTLTK